MSSWTPNEDNPRIYAGLSGDHNPVHLDAAHARSIGFERNIVHGMCMLGASARAAHALAPGGSTLRKLDVRFSNPLYPGQTVTFEGEVKDQDGATKISLGAARGDGDRLLRPANFVFGPADEAWQGDPKAHVVDEDSDVVGDPVIYSSDDIAAYKSVTGPSCVAVDEGVPHMVVLLGMTDALERAFKGLQPPEKEGTWVHLRQANHFLASVRPDVAYVTRIQAGRNTVRHGKDGSLITIPFLVRRADDGALVSTGACTLLYAYAREDA
jgi:hypothetical protein